MEAPAADAVSVIWVGPVNVEPAGAMITVPGLLTCNTTGVEMIDVQAPEIVCRRMLCAVLTKMEAVLAPFDHRFPLADELVNCMESPRQMVWFPEGVI